MRTIGIGLVWMFAVAGCGAQGGGPPQTAMCGDGICSPSEATSCCQDCGCPTGESCNAGKCAAACHESGLSCKADGDCCGALVCNGGTCGTASTCGSSGDSCSNTDPCCSGFDCNAGRCAPTPSCTPSGSACSLDSDCCGQACTEGVCTPPATITFDLSDACGNGDRVQYRFIDAAAGWYWPSPTTAYDIYYGQNDQVQVECVPGEQVCVGADQPSTSWYWGVGIDGNFQCSAGVPCCWTCTTGFASYTFSCG